MRVWLVRGAYSACAPDCEEWIYAEGQIDERSLAQFRSALDAVKPRKPPILITSSGGNVDQAMAIGRLIRARGFDVAVARAELAAGPEAPASAALGKEPKRSPAPPRTSGIAHSRQAFCASACSLILAAGVHRYVGPAALVGLHQMVRPEQTVTGKVRYYRIRTLERGGRIISREKEFVEEKTVSRHLAQAKASPETYRRVRRYLTEMGSTNEVIDLMMTASPESIHWMTNAELASTRLQTDARGGDMLVAPPSPTPPLKTLAGGAARQPGIESFVDAYAALRRLEPRPAADDAGPRFEPPVRQSGFVLDQRWALIGLVSASLVWAIYSAISRMFRGATTGTSRKMPPPKRGFYE